MNRLNKKKLLSHQTDARNDFVELVNHLLNHGNSDEIISNSYKLAIELNDIKTYNSLKSISQNLLHTNSSSSKKSSQYFAWDKNP